MATTDLLIAWDATPTDFTVTNLESLGSGDIWQSGELNAGPPNDQVARISYQIVFNTTPVAGDSVIFRWAWGDQASSNEIWSGGIGTSEGQITAAAGKAEARAGCPVVHEHFWKTSHGTTFKGFFDVFSFGPSWQLLIEANGEALTTGNRVRYRYGTAQSQR
jgi:hypothetical protein